MLQQMAPVRRQMFQSGLEGAEIAPARPIFITAHQARVRGVA